MFQEITIIGNVGTDPEMRYLPDGKPVTNFSVATNRTWKDERGETQQHTTWFRVTVWDKAAEIMNQYINKGALVMVKGELQSDPRTGGPRMYPRKDGTVGANYEIRAITVKFLSKKENGNGHAVADVVNADGGDDDVPY